MRRFNHFSQILLSLFVISTLFMIAFELFILFDTFLLIENHIWNTFGTSNKLNKIWL